MPFVSRDSEGAISAVSHQRGGDCLEEIAADDPALLAFIDGLQAGVSSLAESDRGFIRVLEDLLDLLVERQLIRLQELPEDAQDKIAHRKQLREQLRSGA